MPHDVNNTKMGEDDLMDVCNVDEYSDWCCDEKIEPKELIDECEFKEMIEIDLGKRKNMWRNLYRKKDTITKIQFTRRRKKIRRQINEDKKILDAMKHVNCDEPKRTVSWRNQELK